MLTKKVSQQYIAKAKIPFIGITMEGKKIKLDSTLKIGDISCSTDRPKPNKYYPDYENGDLSADYMFYYDYKNEDDNNALEIVRIFSANFIIFNTFMAINLHISIIFTTFALSN